MARSVSPRSRPRSRGAYFTLLDFRYWPHYWSRKFVREDRSEIVRVIKFCMTSFVFLLSSFCFIFFFFFSFFPVKVEVLFSLFA